MTRKRHGRNRRYHILRAAHFTVWEAKELSQLRKLGYYELPIMARQRRKLWDEFNDLADSKGWSNARKVREWKSTVKSWYAGHNYVERDFAWWKAMPEKNIWIWFRDVSSNLPIEKQCDSPPGSSHWSLQNKETMQESLEKRLDNSRQIMWLSSRAHQDPGKSSAYLAQSRAYGYRGSRWPL